MTDISEYLRAAGLRKACQSRHVLRGREMWDRPLAKIFGPDRSACAEDIQTEAASRISRRRLPRYARLASTIASASWVPIASCIWAVSTYCWKLVALPPVNFHTWQTCASTLLPVAL